MPIVQRSVFKKDLLRKVKHAFTSSGWRVTPSNNFEVDFVVKQGEFTFCIQCVDRSILAYEPTTALVESFEISSRQMLFQRKETFIYIINFDLNDKFFLQKKTINAFNVSEIDLITTVPKMLHSMPDIVDVRLVALFSSKIKILLKIIDNYTSTGNFEKALEWALYAKERFSGFAGLYLRLNSIYQELGQFDLAEDIIRKGLQNQPADLGLLKRLEKILIHNGVSEELDQIQSRITRLSVEQSTTPKNADAFIERHKPTAHSVDKPRVVRDNKNRLSPKNLFFTLYFKVKHFFGRSDC